MNRLSRPLVGFFSATVGALAIVVLFYLTAWGQETKPDIKVDATPMNRAAGAVTSYAPVIKKAAPSVVNIYSTQIIHERLYRNPFFNDPFFRQFFGSQFPNGSRELTRREESLGSGVIISPDGYILTANHVVDGADEIKVAIAENKTEYTAKVVGTDPVTDVAVLKIDATGLPAVTLGDSDQLEVGDVVLAIGNPFGVGQSVTMGIVSALGRNLPMRSQRYAIQDFIQTDAAINPGNSGGALVDAEGRLIGINTSIITDESMHGLNVSGNEGVGFAVPVNLARHVMERLIQGGKVTRGYLGVSLRDLTPALAQDFNMPDQNGALVNDVARNGPAQKAGIISGDVIVEFNGKKITDPNGLQLMVSESSPGTEITVKVIRDGHAKSFTVELAELPGEISQNGNRQKSSSSTNTDALGGVTVQDLDQQSRQELRIPDNIHGALVSDVGPESNSADAGLRRGDVIVEINRQPVNNADRAVKLYTQAKGDSILLKVWRRGGDFGGTAYLSVDNTKPAN